MSIKELLEAVKNGQDVIILVNGEYYELKEEQA